MVALIGILHQVTPSEQLFQHELYRRLGYFPIVVGGLLYGLRGGLIIAFLSLIAFIPHLRHLYHFDLDIYRSDLTEIVLYLSAGALVGFIAGKEKKLREKYRLLSQQLEKSYKKLHKETTLLIEVEEQLRASQKFSALGRLAASLAHEIKNPLAGIRGASEILLDDFPLGHPKREFVDILLKETGRLGMTVDEVLRFSRDQQQQIGGEPALEPLEQMLSGVVRLLETQLRKKTINLSLVIPPEYGSIMVDGNKTAQVFINLILNACEVLRPGGTIEIMISGNADELTITVADDGPGIPEKEREKIFEPFYTNREDGTGLGLAISSRIIESLGGTIGVKDAPGGGALFTVTLPLPETIKQLLK